MAIMTSGGSAVLVVGPGAVGGVLAAHWALKGRKVLLLGRTRASESRLARQGFFFTGPDGVRQRVRRNLASARREDGRRPLAAAFFCVKSHDTTAAIRSARRFIGPEIPVVGLQNGVGHENLLKTAFGAKRTVVGSCYFAADRLAPFTLGHTWGDTIQLASTGRNRAALAAARRLLAEGGWRVSLEGSEDRMLWTKLCFNAATNLLGAICAVPNGRLAKDPALQEIMLKALSEAVRIAKKDGHRPLRSDMAGLVVKGCLAAGRQRNSMLQDLQAGRRTEIEAIARPLLAAARRTRTPAPLLGRLSRIVRLLEKESRK